MSYLRKVVGVIYQVFVSPVEPSQDGVRLIVLDILIFMRVCEFDFLAFRPYDGEFFSVSVQDVNDFVIVVNEYFIITDIQ